MLNLTSSSSALRVQSSSAATLEIHASFADLSDSGTVTLGVSNTIINGTALTPVVAGPSTGVRNVKLLIVRNTHASLAAQVVVSHTDGATAISLHRQRLLPGQSIHYEESHGFILTEGKSGAAGIHGADAFGANALILPTVNASALTTTGAYAVDRIEAIPFIPAKDMTIDLVGLEVTTLVAGGLFKLGIYDNTGTFTPGSLLAGTTDLSSATTGYREQTITPLVLAAGVPVWLAVHTNLGSMVFRGAPIAACIAFGAPGAGGTARNTLYRGGAAPFAAGLPAVFPSPVAQGGVVIPAIRLRTLTA